MKVAAILRATRPTAEVTAIPASTMTTGDAEIDFTIVGVFVVASRMKGKIQAWLESQAIGPWAVRYLEGDGRAVIVMGLRFDAFAFLTAFPDALDVAFLGVEQPQTPATAFHRRSPGGRP